MKDAGYDAPDRASRLLGGGPVLETVVEKRGAVGAVTGNVRGPCSAGRECCPSDCARRRRPPPVAENVELSSRSRALALTDFRPPGGIREVRASTWSARTASSPRVPWASRR